MFGYIRPFKSELKVREYNQYKAVYCELCKELGKSFGWRSRFVLSYDCTFYALLSIGVSGAEIVEKKGRCTTNPIKKCSFICCDGGHYRRAAALCVIMTYYKLLDNIHDSGFLKGLSARLLRIVLSGKARKAAAEYPLIKKNVEQAMREQVLEEKNPSASIDSCAQPTANLLASLFEDLVAEDDLRREALRQFGYFLGRWVYIIDAADDLQEDLKAGSFNPFIKMFSLEGKSQIEDERRRQIEQECNRVLNFTVSMLIPAFNLISVGMFDPILRNIVDFGLPQIQKEILFLHIRDRKG